MAGDWIKMRVLLAKDPKVIAMADFLAFEPAFCSWLGDHSHRACKETALELVSSHVLRCVTVTGLLSVWGVCVETGHRTNECDLTVTHANLTTIDDISGVPSFGRAMEFVGWVVCNQEKMELTFPKYLRDGSCAKDRSKEQARERKRRQRDRQRDSMRDGPSDKSVTVTHREEKNREEKNREKNTNTKRAVFVPPTVEEVDAYCQKRGNSVDGQAFVAFYASKGWKVGNSPMKDWQQAVITWEGRAEKQQPTGLFDIRKILPVEAGA